MGQSNQLYATWVRLLPTADDPHEMYLVIKKDKPMSMDTVRGFDERFAGQDVILTVTKLIREKKGRKRSVRKTG